MKTSCPARQGGAKHESLLALTVALRFWYRDDDGSELAVTDDIGIGIHKT